jgi:long-chain fatty acid transport protein
MRTFPHRCNRLALAVTAAVASLAAGQALGTGFQLNENSGSGVGNAFAAGAAFTDDVSAMWWNPAALTKFPRMQAAGALHLVTPSIEFNDNGSLPAANQPLGGDGGDAGGVNAVPNMYFSLPLSQTLVAGVGVTVPFGLTTEYDDGWIGRYQALKSSIKTMNLNGALGWKVTPDVSVGFGLSYLDLDATLTNNVNYSGALLAAAQSVGVPAAQIGAIAQLTPGLDSKSTVRGDDSGWGWNVGVAWDVTPALRLAASYRSEVDLEVSGTIDFNNPTATLPPGTPPQLAGLIGQLENGVKGTRLYGRDIKADITLPAQANFSVLYRMGTQWEFMGDLQYTGWSSIPELKFVPSDGSTLPPTPLNWDDSWKIAAGASYRQNDKWKWRFGVAFDQTPVTDAPTPRLPDSDRWWLAVGGEYRMTPNLKFDAGFVYIIGESADFDRNEGSTATYGLIKGSYDASTTILSFQATYTF